MEAHLLASAAAVDAVGALEWVGRVAVYLLILGVLIAFHEFGHMVVAKRAGVTVSEFAFGFGPRLFAIDRGGTLYTVNLLPLGGFCRMVGEDSAEDGSADPGNFQHKSLLARSLIIIAGPVFNFILAAVMFSVLAVAIGQPTPTSVIEVVAHNSPAERAGLVKGDQILSLDGNAFRSADEMVDYIHGRPNKLIAVDLRHGSTVEHLKIKTMYDPRYGGVFGFQPLYVPVRMNLGAGILWGLDMVPRTIAANGAGLAQMIATRDTRGLAGPVGIARMIITAESSGIFYVLNIAAQMSVILGMFNLLPIPALDGGRLAFFFVELIRGRRVDPEKEGLVHLTGFALLMVLIVFVTYRDIVLWVSGKGQF
jgi:regulator of sigma E protease